MSSVLVSSFESEDMFKAGEVIYDSQYSKIYECQGDGFKIPLVIKQVVIIEDSEKCYTAIPYHDYYASEAQALEQLTGLQCVPKLFGTKITCSGPYGLMGQFAMERLDHVPEAKTLNYANLNDIVTQMFNAVATCHIYGVMHRDIKLDNFMMRGDKVVLIDFGLAATNAVYPLKGHRAHPRGYRAPEVIWDGLYSYGADAWALGVTIIDFVLHQSIFSGYTMEDIAASIEAKFFPDKYPGSCALAHFNWTMQNLSMYLNETNLELVKKCFTWDPSPRESLPKLLGWNTSPLYRKMEAGGPGTNVLQSFRTVLHGAYTLCLPTSQAAAMANNVIIDIGDAYTKYTGDDDFTFLVFATITVVYPIYHDNLLSIRDLRGICYRGIYISHFSSHLRSKLANFLFALNRKLI